MTFAEFKRSLRKAKPPPALPPALAALWWTARGEWQRAHSLVMDDPGGDCAWVHAYLHRVEGDLANARYWYQKAAKSPASNALQAEWTAIVSALLAKETAALP